MQLVRAKKISSSGVLPLTRLESKITRFIGRDSCFGDACRRNRGGVFCCRQIPTRPLRRVYEVRSLGLECRSSRGNLRPLPLATLPVEIRAVQLLAQLAQRPISALYVGTRHAEGGANFLLVPSVTAQGFVRRGKRGLELRQLTIRPLEFGTDAPRYRIALAPFFFRALPA